MNTYYKVLRRSRGSSLVSPLAGVSSVGYLRQVLIRPRPDFAKLGYGLVVCRDLTAAEEFYDFALSRYSIYYGYDIWSVRGEEIESPPPPLAVHGPFGIAVVGIRSARISSKKAAWLSSEAVLSSLELIERVATFSIIQTEAPISWGDDE